MYRKRYPPVRYVFYPLYRKLRRGIRLPQEGAYVAVWMISGVFHGFVVLLFGNPVPALVFAAIFFGLGLIGAWAHFMKRRQRRAKVTEHEGVGDDHSSPIPTPSAQTIGEQAVDPNA